MNGTEYSRGSKVKLTQKNNIPFDQIIKRKASTQTATEYHCENGIGKLWQIPNALNILKPLKYDVHPTIKSETKAKAKAKTEMEMEMKTETVERAAFVHRMCVYIAKVSK